MKGALYVDTSAVLRAALEADVSPEIETRLNESERLLTSRLSPLESARAFLRLRRLGELSEAVVADAESAVRSVWTRCEILELNEVVCDLAELVAPGSLLRALDALHLASFVVARRHIEDLELLTVDQRLLAAVDEV
ncbi:MAG: type II toxin-antitoxin system VapC family toxin [Gemmatimonadota bacterium]